MTAPKSEGSAPGPPGKIGAAGSGGNSSVDKWLLMKGCWCGDGESHCAGY